MAEDLLLFAGSASRRLGAAVAEYLDCPLGRSETLRFSEGNLFVRVLENVRGRDTYIVQSTAFPANDNFTVETQPEPLPTKTQVVSVAGLFGEAIHRIARRESISVLFE